MDLCIAYIRPEDGGLSVVHPAPRARLDGETDEDFAARIAAKDVPPGVPFQIVRKETLPIRRFREAWEYSDGKVEVNHDKARAALLAELRGHRNRKLAAADALKAKFDDLGTPAQQKSIKVHRQALRDLPAVVEAEIASMTAEQLLAYQVPWPADE